MTSQDLSLGSVLSGRYRIDGFIAEGGMATVYRGYDLRLERDVAIKVVKPELASNEGFTEAFIAEAKLAAKVNSANLVNVFDQGVAGDVDYIVMELVEGKTLRAVLTKFGSLDSTKAVAVTSAVLTGLSALHRAGIVHRDVKPENVILANDGRIKVTDFGLARPSLQAQIENEPLLGTVAYIAPEVIRGQRISPSSDVYSVGIMLYELLTGVQPFTGPDSKTVARMHLQEEMPKLREKAVSASVALEDLVAKATTKSPDGRFADADQLLAALKGLSVAPDNQTKVIDNKTELIANQTELIDAEDLEAELAEAKEPKRFLAWLIASAAAIAIGIGAGWWFGTGPGALITVPSVTSMTEAEAHSSLELLPINVTSVDENSDSPIGTVTHTDPAAGSYLARGGTLTLFLSIGPKLNTVPDLHGKNLIDATAALRAANFWVGKTDSAFNELPIGQVFDFTGSDGSVLADGSSVDLKISLGPIPVVKGVSIEVAKGLLTAVGLTVGKVTESYSDDVKSGQVISVIPQNVEVTKGTALDIVVSKGSDRVTMPKVVGETISASKLALEQLGLRVAVDTNVLSSKWGIAKVKSASASAGSILRIGDLVTIVSR